MEAPQKIAAPLVERRIVKRSPVNEIQAAVRCLCALPGVIGGAIGGAVQMSQASNSPVITVTA